MTLVTTIAIKVSPAVKEVIFLSFIFIFFPVANSFEFQRMEKKARH